MGKFYSPKEYKRFVFGKNFEDGYAEKMLMEFAEFAVDSPKLTEVSMVENITIIPVPSDVSTADFMNLVRWLTQKNGVTSYGIAINETDSYFVIPDTMNRWGDTVLIGFDNGTAGKWELPIGFSDESSAFFPMNKNIFEYFEGSEHIEEIYGNCKDFLNHKGMQILIDYI